MNNRELRSNFREFVGPERYKKFVRAINRECRRKERLLFWQEQLWREFTATIPNAPQSDGEIIASLSVCDVHDAPLQPRPANTLLSAIRETPEADLAADREFPFAVHGDIICLDCLAARARWVAEHSELCRVLRRKTTYEDYCRQYEGLVDQPAMRDKIKARWAEISAQMQPGDELWEWDGGGWHQLTGRAGIAVVREGIIVKQWCDRRS